MGVGVQGFSNCGLGLAAVVKSAELDNSTESLSSADYSPTIAGPPEACSDSRARITAGSAEFRS